MHNYINSIKAIFHQKECAITNDECFCAISDEKVEGILNKFIKDAILCMFLDNSSIFNGQVDLVKFHISYVAGEVKFILPKEAKTVIRKILKRDNINININLE